MDLTEKMEIVAKLGPRVSKPSFGRQEIEIKKLGSLHKLRFPIKNMVVVVVVKEEKNNRNLLRAAAAMVVVVRKARKK